MEQQETEAFREQVKAFTEALQSLTGTTEKSALTVEDALGKKFPNAAPPAIAALKGLGNAITDTTAALYKGQRGMGVMANGLDKLADGVQAAAAIFTIFTPMGKALSIAKRLIINGLAALPKILSSTNKLTAEQSDNLYKAYQNLSNVGAAGAGGLEKLFDTMQQAGFTVAELDQFAAALKRNSRDLTNFGATTAQGAENLAKMSGDIIKGDLGLSLMNLGYTSESLADSTNNYIALQNQLGRVQLKTATQLRTEATAYAFELDKLTRLTGLSREDMEKRQRSLMSDERYAGFMATEAKRQGYDTDKLTNFFSLIEDESTRKGLQHMLAGGGVGNSEEARRIIMTDPMAYERMMRVARGGSAAEEAQGFYGAAKQYMGGMGGELARYGGKGPGILLGSNLADAERMDQMTAAAKAEGMTLDKFLETEQGKAMRDKGELERQNKLRLQQLGAAQALDSTVKKFDVLNKITATLSETFTNVIKKLGGKVAGGVPGAPADKQEVPTKTGSFSGKEKEFYDKMYGTLLDKATKAGVANPEAIARLGAAQSALETGYGKHTAAGNNYFGIKARAGDPNASMVNTQEYDPVSGKMVTQKAGFRKYRSMEESAADYIKFLQENPRYKSVLSSNSAADAIAAQGRTGYATDPNYAKKLQSIHASGFNGTTSGPASGFRPNPLGGYAGDLATYSGDSSKAAAAQAESRAEANSTAQLITKVEELIDVNKAMHGTNQRLLRYAQ